MNTHGLKIEVGKHAGTLYTRLPVPYLRWMINSRHEFADIAAAELKRRGTSTPMMDISGHAIDRASVDGLEVYLATRNHQEGIHAWLLRITEEAMANPHEPAKPGKYVWPPLLLCVETEGLAWPVLKTVIYSPKACKLPRAQDPPHDPASDQDRNDE